MGILYVNKKKPTHRPRVVIRHAWLPDFGFAHNASALATHQTDGFTVSLCDGTSATTNDEPIIHVRCNSRGYTSLSFSIPQNGSALVAGDILAAKYEHGIITAQKLPHAQKYYVISSHVNYPHDPFLDISGHWLSDIGFAPDTIVTASMTKGLITLSAWMDKTKSYSELVQFARKNKYQIIQTRKNQLAATLEIPGYLLANAGFAFGGIIGVYYAYGRIKFFKPDLQKLGL